MTSETILKKIIEADSAVWNWPSPARALEVSRLEREYQELTGKTCPPWPSRGRW